MLQPLERFPTPRDSQTCLDDLARTSPALPISFRALEAAAPARDLPRSYSPYYEQPNPWETIISCFRIKYRIAIPRGKGLGVSRLPECGQDAMI